MMGPDVQKLRDAFDRHRSTMLPEDSDTSEELSDAHADLIEYDGYVAGYRTAVSASDSTD